ncbi:toxin glutamine deamidase domain-containing protein [Nocardia sp. NPDC024068]|uniref:toxin glutamine deamidase domain-containing protein n=1 Tax=Nocardia sp. NPDC024068 TaxID=3157197 RepID=UPI0033CCC510
MLLTNPSKTRVFGPELLAPVDNPESQRALEDALRGDDGAFIRYADPRTHPAGGTPYGELINIRGPGALGRGNNCLDCAISALATFLGRPEVAAPRYPDIVDGVVDTVGNEKKALNRVFHMLRTYPDSYRDGSRSIPEQFTAMHEWIAHLGEGSAAFVNNEWPVIDPATGAPVLENGKPKTYAHATVIVYPRGATGPVWWDPQSGGMSDGPPPDMVASTAKVDFIPIPPGRVVLDANTTPAPPVPVPPPAPPPGPVVQPVHTRPDPPARLTDPAQSRTFGPGHLDPVEHPGLQKVLEDALTDGSGGFVAGADPRTFPTPGDPYARMINAGGPALPGRASNKIDAALSALSSFLGNPQVAAPRHPDLGPNGFDGKDEQSGHVRAAQWLQSTPNYFDRSQPVAQQYTHLHNWIHHLGQGSAALVFSVVPQRDPGTGAILRDPQNRPVTIMQPTVIVYPPSASGPVWWNPVSGETWDGPPENLVRATAGFGFIPIPPGRSVDTSPAAPVPPPAAAGPTPPGPAGAPGDRREAGNTRFEPLADPSGAPLQLRQRLRRLLHETTRSAPAPTMGPVELVPRPDLSLRTAPPPERVGTTDPGSDEQNAPPVPPEPEQQHGARQDAESPESDIALGAPPDGTDPDVRMTDPAASPTGDPEPGTSGTAGTKRPLPEPQPVAGPAKRPQLEEATQPAPPVVPAAGPVPPPPEPPAPQIPDSQQTVMPKPVYDRPWPGPQLVNGNDTRMYGPGWLAPLEDPALQQQFEDAMRDDDGNFVKYADPRTFPSPDNPYGSRINAGGTTAPGRSKNCCDCSVSGLMSFLGLPQVALPRYHQIVNGVVDTGGSDGIDQTRLYQMLGNRPNSFNDGYRSINQQFLAIHDYVKNLGEGAAAYVSFHWQPRDPRTGRPMVRNGRPVLSGHATLVVHPVGAAGPVWWDPQGGIMSDRPTARLTYSTVRVDFIPIPPGRSVLPSLADRRASAPAAPPAPVRDPVREPVIAPVHHRPEPPAVLDNPADSRRFEPGGLREVEHPGFQKALEDALRDADGRYLIAADPRTHPRSEHPYGTMINPGGTALGGRGTNRFDAALSALSTFLGKPEVAARREPDPAVAGNDRADEAGGRDRAIRWLGSEPTGFDETLPMGRQYDALHNWVAQLGPGSAALVLPAKPGLDPQTGLPRPAPDGRVALDDPEPLVVVYPPSSAGPVWWNPVTGETWDAPPPSLVDTTAKLEFFPIPPGRTIAGAAPTAPASPRQVSQPVADRGLPPGPSDTARGDPESDPPARSSPNPHDPAGTPFHLRERFRRWTQRLPAEPPQVQPVAHAAEPVPPVTRPAPDPDPPGPGPASERRDPGSPAVSPAPSRVPTPPPPAPPPPRHGHPPPPRQVVHPDKSRVYGPGQLAPLEGPGPQRALEQAMRDKDGHFVRYSDPRVHPVGGRPYGELVNAAGLSAPGRETNCVDCALAALATFFGRPMVAAPAFFRVANSVIGPSGPEAGGADRITHTFRTGFDSYDYDGRSVPEQFDAITKWVAHLGPGSAAVVTNRWQAVDPRTGDPLINPDGSPKTAGAHALVVVYPVGAAGPVWWDPQSGDMSVRPPENMDQRSASVEFLPIPPGRTVIAEPPDGSPPLPPPATVSRPLPAIGPRRRRPAAMLLADPAESRRFERGYLDELEHPGYRTALEDALRDRDGNFVVAADPRTYPTTALPYGKLVNGGGPISPQRSYNKIDAALSGLSSFLGTPRVAVPRYPDPGLGRGYRDDEHGGLHRLQFWGRTNLSRFGSEIGPEAAHFPALHDWVDGLGPGSAAVAVIGIGTRDPYSGSLVSSFSDETEILLVVYPAGAPGPVWWNPVTGQTWDAPPAREFPDAVDFRFLEVPPGRRVDGKSGVQANVGPLVGPSVSQPEPPRRLAPPAADRDQHFGPVDPVAQQALENALGDGRGGFVTAADPRSFPTPASPYRTLVNPADPASPGFGLNTFDAALSALSSFFGAPQVAAPRPPQAGPDDEDAGAGDGIDRLLRWAKTDLDDFPARSMAEQFAALHDWVKHLGPGAAAVAVGVTVQVDQNTGTFDRTLPDDQLVVMGAAAPVVVFPRGAAEPVWWDPVTGAVWDSPPLSLIQRTAYLNFVAFPPGRSIDTAQANTGAAQNPAGDPLATEIEEGVIDESAATDRGTGTQSPPGGTSGRPSVLHRPDADRRLAPPAGDHRRGRGNRSRDRDVVPGRGVGYRGDPAVSELVGSDGDGGLHGGGDRRPGTGGTADLSAPDPDRIAADRREPGGGRIPGQRDIGTETGGTVLDGDSEGHAVAQPDEQRRDGRRGVGELAAGAGRNLAGDGDHRVLTDGPDPVAAPDSPGRSPGVRGHGRPQRRRPIEWSLPTGFRAPDAAGVSWLPPGAVPGDGPRPDTDAPDIPPTADGPAADPDRPEVDVPFTLNDSDPGTA